MRRAAVLLAGLACAGAGVAPPPGASSCSGCHGAGVAGGMPVIAGRDAASLLAAMDGFRTDERPATVMGRISKGFTHDEAAAIAAWWARPQ